MLCQKNLRRRTDQCLWLQRICVKVWTGSEWFRYVNMGVITFLHLLELMLGRQPHVRGCIPKSHISLLSSSLLPFCGEVKQDKETEVPEPFSLQELGGGCTKGWNSSKS